MKIAVASDDGVSLAAHTGRCLRLVVFDVGADGASREEDRPNVFTAHALGECSGEPHVAGGAHHSHSGLIGALSDCSALITRGLGRRLMGDLNAAGIEVCVCSVDRVDEAAALYAQGKLPRVKGTGCCHRP
jgi:predicted Fe-Mo cluster-binding NifX family protein